MPWFRHPYLVRGVVHTPLGAFRLDRGVADLPQNIGEALGWQPMGQFEDVRGERVRDPLAPDAVPRSMPPNVAHAAEPAHVVDRFREENLTDGDRGAATRSLDTVLAAVTAAVRGRKRIEVPDHGIHVAFDGGIVATCVRCRVSWEVSRQHFNNLAWWRCPSGCRL